MFRQQHRLTLFALSGHQHAWHSSLVSFRVGSPERFRSVTDHGNGNVFTIRNFTSTIIDTRRRSGDHLTIITSSSSSPPLPSPHCLIDLKSSLMSSLIINSNSRLRYEKRFSTNARSNSSSNSDSTTATEKTPTASVVASSLRRMIKPFLLKCHPDIQQHRQQNPASNDEDDDDNASISQDDANWAKAINLRAIQNLNSYLDSIQTLLHESSSSSSSVRQRRNLKNDSSSSLVEIDFVIAIQSSSSSLKSGGKKRHQSRRNRGIEWHQSRRKVQLVLPPHDSINNVSMSFLERHVHSELVRLLRVAGLEVPMYSFHSLQHDDDYSRKQDGVAQGGANDATHSKGPYWHDIDGLQSLFHFPFGAPPNKKSGKVISTTSVSSSIFSRYKANRQDYIRDTTANKNWNKETRFFQHAMAECFMEDETRGLIANDAARRQDLIAHILAKVQIQKQQQQQQQQVEELEQEESSTSTTNNDNDDNDDNGGAATTTNSSSHNNIVVVDDAGLEQLLAMRRLSLVLDDNFQVLQLEELGQLWENLTLVLLLPPPSSSWDNDNDYRDDDEPTTATTTVSRRMRRTKRRRMRQMQQHNVSGNLDDDECWQMMDYAWTLHPDWSVTMHIPMDFEPDELVQELERNVQDFNRLLEEQTYHDYYYYYGSGGGGFPYNYPTSSSSSAAAV